MKRLAPRARDQVQDHLGVGGRLQDGAVAHQLAAQRQAVGEIAVVADREAAGVEIGEQRLDVAQQRLAGGRIAHMADRHGAGQAVDDLAAREGVADKAETALGMEAVAVEADDAGRLLAAVLQGVQAERRDGGGVGVPVDAEYAAFFAQPVAVEDRRRDRGRFGVCSARLSRQSRRPVRLGRRYAVRFASSLRSPPSCRLSIV